MSDANLNAGLSQMLCEETPMFEAMLQALRPRQISLLGAIAKEPVAAPFAVEYINRHRLGSLGGVQAAMKKLSEIDYIEKTAIGWKVPDPLFALWLKRKEAMEF